MAKVTYNLVVGKNEGLIISPSELLEQYFFGTYPKTTDGQDFPIERIKAYILEAQDQVEDLLSLKLVSRVVTESYPFNRQDYEQWGYIQTTYPVFKPKVLYGFISDVRQITYPPEWLSAKITTDGKGYHRRVSLVPGSNSANSSSVVYSGITPHLGFLGQKTIPEYWRLSYETGWEPGKVPKSIKSLVSKVSALPIFAILGDLIIGAGIASQSLSIDGLSQSVSTTSSATNSGYGARMLELQKQIKAQVETLKSQYVGINFTVL